MLCVMSLSWTRKALCIQNIILDITLFKVHIIRHVFEYAILHELSYCFKNTFKYLLYVVYTGAFSLIILDRFPRWDTGKTVALASAYELYERWGDYKSVTRSQ